MIAGSPSRTYSARNASACSRCVAAHRRTPCRFGVIADHLPPRPTNPSTQRSSVIPSGIVVCRYHNGGGLDKIIALVVARVEGIGPMLPILEGGRCVCHFVFGLHRLWWQHRVFLLGLRGQNLPVKSAYRRYIRWTKTNIDANYIRVGLDALHQLCYKRHIKMDVESELLRGAVDVLTRSYDTG